jgi:S1-C subfamily serine protease
MVRLLLIFLTTITAVPVAQAQPADDSLRIYAAEIGGSTGVYLGRGLVLTAAHVVGAFRTHVGIRIAGVDVDAKVVKAGSSYNVDLSLLSVEPASLPIRVQMRQVVLCTGAPTVGQPVLVAGRDSTAPSKIASPLILPPSIRTKYSTIIPDVATTGDSGSGVFDARTKCLLGIMSLKISRPNNETGGAGEDIAKYFVPASEIRGFIPAWFWF